MCFLVVYVFWCFICAHWLVNNFRFVQRGIRGVFGDVLNCFSGSLLSMFRIKNQVHIVKCYRHTYLFTIKILLRSLTSQ